MTDIDRYYTDHIEVANEYFTALLANKPDDYVRMFYAYHLARNEEYEAALMQLAGANRNKNLSFYLMVEGYIEHYSNKSKGAIEKLLYSASLDKSNKWVRLELFSVYNDSEEYKAWGYLEEALKIDQNFNEAIYLRVFNYDTVTNRRQIISEIMTMPQTYIDAKILNLLACAFHNDHQSENALKILNGSLEKEETSYAYYLKGLIVNQAGDYEGAMECFDKSLSIESAADVLVAKAWLYDDLGKSGEVKKILDELTDYETDIPSEIFREAIWLCFKNKYLDKAGELIDAARVANGADAMSEGYQLLLDHARKNDIQKQLKEYKGFYGELAVNWLKAVFEDYAQASE